MGDPKFDRKTYESPRNPWEITRIKDENNLRSKYGLKNKREIWKALSVLRSYRAKAIELQAKLRYNDVQAQKEFKELSKKLINYGMLNENSANLDSILSLTVENILDRRLETLVYMKGLANTPKQARQFIVHGHISIGNRAVSIPSYMVKKEEEPLLNYKENSPLSNELHPMRVKEAPKEGETNE